MKYRVIHILRAATDGCRSRPCMAGPLPHGASNCRCPQTLALFFSSVSEEGIILVMRIDVSLQNGDVSIYWLWLLLDISAVSVVVIIAICDMPRQELSLRERVYIHNTYMNNRKSCSETRKFRIKFPGRHVPNPSTIRELAKWFKETGCVKNRKVNTRRHVLKEETLDDIGERLEHAPQKSLKRLS